jgi:hypothetical protein
LAVGGHRAAAVQGTGMARPRSRPPVLGQDGLGPEPKPGRLAFFPHARTQAETVPGQFVSLGRPVSNKKNCFFVFLLLFMKRNALENGCVIILALKIVK